MNWGKVTGGKKGLGLSLTPGGGLLQGIRSLPSCHMHLCMVIQCLTKMFGGGRAQHSVAKRREGSETREVAGAHAIGHMDCRDGSRHT
eukprot:4797397-Amphidinium_carterae.1